MPFNGSGVFLRVRNWVNDAASNIKIRADRHDTEDDNFAAGLTNCITKDGQTTVTANLPMAGFRHTGVGLASQLTHYSRYDQVATGKFNWAEAGGTADALEVNFGITFTTLEDGQEFCIRCTDSNTTTTPTLSIDGLTAKTLVNDTGGALTVGALSDGLEIVVRYNSSDDHFVILGTQPLADGSVTTAKIADLAVTTAKLATNAVTPAKTDTTVTALSAGAGTKTMDLSGVARSFTLTVSGGANTLAFSNVKASGNEEIVTIRLTNGGSQTVNYPSGTQTAGGEPFPDLTASGDDELIFKTINGGTNWVLSYLLDVQAP